MNKSSAKPGPMRGALVGGCALAVAIACQHPATASKPSGDTLPPPLPPERVSAPVLTSSVTTSSASAAPAPEEKRITLSTYGRDSDVKPLLQFIAQQGGFSLVLPTGLERRVNVDLRDVPVSEALETVLTAAGLSLAPTTGITNPSDTSVVFYQLPVNVDSLSAEAIMKRFGVSREMAELIVKSRKP